MSFCSLIKGITPKIRTLYFVLVNNVRFDRLHVWILKLGMYRIVCLFRHRVFCNNYNPPTHTTVSKAVRETQFSSAQDSIYALKKEKSPYALHSVSQKFPQSCF